MSVKPEVWYVEGSRVAAALKPLARRMLVRAWNPNGLRNGRAVPELPESDKPAVFVVDLQANDLSQVRPLTQNGAAVRVVGLAGRSRPRNGRASDELFACLPSTAPADLLERTIATALSSLELERRERAVRDELVRTQQELEELHRVGVALSSERDIDALLRLILEKSRRMTQADAGSLYLVEEGEGGQRWLRFTHTQNDSVQFPFVESTLPISEESMAGHVALHGEVINLEDAYRIPADRPYRFNPAFDQQTGYRTRSMLTLPMKNPRGDLVGVVQLINCKRSLRTRLKSVEDVERHVLPFSPRAARLALSLASQAAVAYETNKLYREIEAVFESFVSASVTAIEQRDPTTSGHSFRVATLTVGLAETVNRLEQGPYASVHFSAEQMKEIRYAALLHDFGKVAVREEVLVKAKKLYPEQLALVQQRFDYIRKELEAQTLQRKLQYLLERSREEALQVFDQLDDDYRRHLAELDDYLHYILQVNEPTVLPEGTFERLREIAAKAYTDPRGARQPYLNRDEIRFLSIPQGTLDPDERLEIESHVEQTYRFLMQIPWTRDIRGIPQIARAHHEMLNGTGYPHRLRGDQIPFPTRMMTVCDIYDALSAADRPYKKAVSTEMALDILEMSVRAQELDGELFRLFRDAKIYDLTARR